MLLKGLSRSAISTALNDSLKRLETDYIDVFWIHRFDPDTPIEETMHALHDLVVAGKIRYLGASSMWTYQFVMMQAYAEKNGLTKFVAMQVRTESRLLTRSSGLLIKDKNRYNLLYREEEREMIKYCNETGVAVVPVRGPLISRSFTIHLTDCCALSPVGPTCRRTACSSPEHSRNDYQVCWWR